MTGNEHPAGRGRQPHSVDGILPARPITRPSRPSQAPPAMPPEPQTPAKKPQRLRRIIKALLQASALMALLLIGLLSRYAVVGQAMIGVYALCVVIFRIESRTTFTLAIMSLAVVLVSSVRTDRVLAGAFAIYAFMFLSIGVVSLSREIHDTL